MSERKYITMYTPNNWNFIDVHFVNKWMEDNSVFDYYWSEDPMYPPYSILKMADNESATAFRLRFGI